MIEINGAELRRLLDYPSLINQLEKAFKAETFTPARHHHDFNQGRSNPSTLLLMPAWIDDAYLGVKLVTISPENTELNLPTIQGNYLLFDAKTGSVLAQINMPVLTNLRTAATSALASRYLSKVDAETLLIVGTGSLAPDMIRAHSKIRSFRRVMVWGRNVDKAMNLREKLSAEINLQVKEDLEWCVKQADVISCITMSSQPLIEGTWLSAGVHLDLVGAYRPDMREVDDVAIQRAKVFYDTPQGMWESGDLAIPLNRGVIEMEDLRGSLKQLCRGEVEGRRNNREITVFKSVGHASEDLWAAILAFERSIYNTTDELPLMNQ